METYTQLWDSFNAKIANTPGSVLCDAVFSPWYFEGAHFYESSSGFLCKPYTKQSINGVKLLLHVTLPTSLSTWVASVYSSNFKRGTFSKSTNAFSMKEHISVHLEIKECISTPLNMAAGIPVMIGDTCSQRFRQWVSMYFISASDDTCRLHVGIVGFPCNPEHRAYQYISTDIN